MRIFALSAALLAAAPAAAGVHPPEIEARLAAAIGDWTIKGMEKTYSEKCDWYGDRAFVVCVSEDSSDGSSSRSIMGYSSAERHFTYHNYSASGSSNTRIGFPHGEAGMVYTTERKVPEGTARITTFLTPEGKGVRFREERSLNGGPWQVAMEFNYIPRQR
ncbi:MAG TPA: hypothetical protein VF782_06950 [Allosphingosinicella sp.]|jgi:hypothetical protein